MTDQSNDVDEGKQKIEAKPKFKAESSKTAAMMKPSDFSDEEVDDGRSASEKELESQKLKLEKQLEHDFLEGEKHLEQALNREMDLQKKLTSMRTAIEERTVEEGIISEQTEAVLKQDLEELITQQGEDIDFEFFYEGKQILASQSIFQIIKDTEAKKNQVDQMQKRAEQFKQIQIKEEILKEKMKLLSEAKNSGDKEQEINYLKKQTEELHKLFGQIQSQFGFKGGPPQSLFSSLNAHKIYFCIREKSDDLGDFKTQRLDSLTEFTNSASRRGRTKSEAVKDISSSSINQFVQQLLEKEFKVFDDETLSPATEQPGDKAEHELGADRPQDGTAKN